jgi:hypothetical protein
MRFASSRQLFRLGLGAIALLLVLGPFAPRPAWAAGCNHLVTSKVPYSQAFASLDALITGARPLTLDRDLTGGLPHRSKPSSPLPCSGPSCSGRVPFPSPLSTALTGADSLNHWGLLCFESLDPARPTVRKHRECDIDSHAAGVLSPVFHPPRFFAS